MKPNDHTEQGMDQFLLREPQKSDMAPKYQVFGKEYDSNAPSVLYPGTGEYLVLLLSGTGAPPAASDHFMSSVNEEHLFPVIGLSYCFTPQTDVQRNEAIVKHWKERSPENLVRHMTSESLSKHHLQAFEGGESAEDDATLPGVGRPARSSKQGIRHRLHSLLQYLIASRSEEEGWSRFYAGNHMRWDKVILVGYSQGAGHMLHMATKTRCRGLVLISGTQEIVPDYGGEERVEGRDDVGDHKGPWMNDNPDYDTPNVVAFKHAKEEGGALMDRNWECIPPLGLKDGVQKEDTVEVSGGGETADLPPRKKAKDGSEGRASIRVTRLTGSKGGRCFHVHEEPSPHAPSSRPYHVSMMIDAGSPDQPGLRPPKLYYHTLYPFMISTVLSFPDGYEEEGKKDPAPSSKL